MSDFNTVRDLPNNQDAYFNWRNGWIFGLPDSDHPQSEECGAMPFRYGKPQNTVNAQKCLRGEDWAFLNSFCTMYKNLPSSTIWPRNDPAVPQLVQSPARLEIQRMYDYLKHFEQMRCWGSGILLEKNSGVICSSQADIYTKLAAQIYEPMVVQSSAPLATQPLSMQQMKDFFRDTQKFQCTITDAGYQFTNGSRTVWMYDEYVPEAHMPVEIETSDIIQVHVVNSFGVATQKIRMIGQAIMGVDVDVDQGGESHQYYAAVTAGNTFEMTTSQATPYQMSATVNITGQQIANAVGSLGINVRPAAVGGYNSGCRIRPRWRFCVVWPKWLISYYWPED